MKLEYQINQLRGGEGWHCNFCSFESNKNSIATHEMISYNTKTSGYNDIAYICDECERDLDNGTLPHCNECGRAMRNRTNCFCDLRKNEPVKTLSIAEIMGQSYVGRLEQQNKDLKQQLTSAKLEISVHLEALETSKDWHNNQKQELLDKVNGLERKIEYLEGENRKLKEQQGIQNGQTSQIEIKTDKKLRFLPFGRK